MIYRIFIFAVLWQVSDVAEEAVGQLCPENTQWATFHDGVCYRRFIVPNQGIDFEEAIKFCAERESSLPIASDSEVEKIVSLFGTKIWIGIICDVETKKWMWLNHRPLEFENFESIPAADCVLVDVRFATDTTGKWRSYDRKELFEKVVCAKRLDRTSEAEVGSSTASSLQWIILGVFAGLTFIAVVCLALFFARRLLIRKRIPRLPDPLPVLPGIQIPEADDEVEEVNNQEDECNYDEDEPITETFLAPVADEFEIDPFLVNVEHGINLGQGAFGIVYQARVHPRNLPTISCRSINESSTLVDSEDRTAIKMLLRNAERPAKEEFLREINVMKTLGFHPRVVCLLACSTLVPPLMLVMEFCEGKDLIRYLKKKCEEYESLGAEADIMTVFPLERQLRFAMDIATGMEYISSRGFVHRDLAARNILLDKSGHCKVGDFGMCRRMGEDMRNDHSIGNLARLRWMAPESLANGYYSSKSDMWSFGIVLFEIATLGCPPYPDWEDGELKGRLMRGQRMKTPVHCPEVMRELMHSCWRSDPIQRPDFSDLRWKVAAPLEQLVPDENYVRCEEGNQKREEEEQEQVNVGQ